MSQEEEGHLEELFVSSSNKIENSSTKTQTDIHNHTESQPAPVGGVVIEERNEHKLNLYEEDENDSNPQHAAIHTNHQMIGSATPTTRANLEPTATVKFILMPMNQVVTLACSLRMTIAELKTQFSIDLKIDQKYLQLIHSFIDKASIIPDDNLRLMDLGGVEPNGIIQFKIVSIDPINNPLSTYEQKERFLAPDVITVHVEMKNNQFKELIVEIERSQLKKPFLGGFKNKLDGKEFLNASCQTVKQLNKTNDVLKFSVSENISSSCHGSSLSSLLSNIVLTDLDFIH